MGAVDALGLGQWLHDAAGASVELDTMLAVDEFNYCTDVGDTALSEVAAVVDDAPLSDEGVSLVRDLIPFAEAAKPNLVPAAHRQQELPRLSAAKLHDLLRSLDSKRVSVQLRGDTLHVRSRLPEDRHAYIYARRALPRKDLNLIRNSQYELLGDYSESFDFKFVVEFQDARGTKLAHSIVRAGGAHTLAIPADCRLVRLGFRVQGSGEARVSELVLGPRKHQPVAVVGRTRSLVLTKQYPAYDDLYKYGFLHSRVRAYREVGLPVDVFRISDDDGATYREFEGVDIASGNASLLDATLALGKYQRVLVHVLDEKMWDVLQRHLDRVHVTVWVHGAEIQVWQRREFEFEQMSEDEVDRQKKLSDRRRDFWRSILSSPHPNLHLVFVSKYFYEEVSADLDVRLGSNSYSIIHNYIDEKLFPYRPKAPSQRCNVLSIRPYASRKYANDLSVAAVVELSKRPGFDQFNFAFYGDGELFDTTVEPLKAFPNVAVEKRFLSHAQIASLHADYGVILTPTRMDAQGVSRDEGMSSGLVPVTTRVAAIPEFVDESCGVVVPPEDPVALADALERLRDNPEWFLSLSRAASQRVRVQSGFDATIALETRLIRI
jgi:glycosyltransferase involved in cell wall biosynthesis